MVKVENVSMSFKGNEVLSDISFLIPNGQKIGLVGKNGVGKSTLMRIIAGIESPTSGKVSFDNESFIIGYLRQEFEAKDSEKRVSDYIDEAVGITALRDELERISNTDLSIPKNFEAFDIANEAFLAMDGYNFDYRKESTFSGLSLDTALLNQKVSELSGGQKSKVLLSVVLLMNADLLLLDEPTNNLDIKSIQWLDNYLRRISTSCLIISHDRILLDHLVSKIIEIDSDKKETIEFTGNYSDYIAYKEKQQARQLEAYESQQELITSMQKSIKQKKSWAAYGRYQGVSDNDKYTRGYERNRSSSIASSAKRIEKKISQMTKIERPIIHEPLRIKLNISSEDKGTVSISANNLICGYDNGFSVEVGSISIEFGDRVLILGDNGTGKTTFVKTLLSIIKPIQGNVNIGSGVKLGLLLQQEFKGMNLVDVSVEEYIRDNTECDSKVFLTSMVNFGFAYDDRVKTVATLSPGELARLYLLICSLNEINVLILDEPTNYLDIEALNALEEIVSSFEGTIIASSHDRFFIDKFNPSYTLEFKNGRMTKRL